MSCHHNWKRTGMFLMKYAPTYADGGGISGNQIVGGNQGYYGHQTPEVEWCDRCGLLRVPLPAETPEKPNG